MLRILIVEDDDIIRSGLTNEINRRNESFEVVGAVADGRKALEFLKTNVTDVIITDINMPVMNGLELAERINKDMPFIKVIILSGYADFQYAQAAIRSNVYEYILKPLKLDELINVLMRINEQIQTEKSKISTEKQKALVKSLLTRSRLENDVTMPICGEMRCAVFAIDDILTYDNYICRRVNFIFDEFCTHYCENKYENSFLSYLIEDNFLLIIIEGSKNDVRDIYNELRKYIEKSEDETFCLSCGVSEAFYNIRDIESARSQAYSAIASRFYTGNNIFAEYSKDNKYRQVTQDENKRCRQLISKIPMLIINGEGASTVIDEIFEYLTLQPYPEPKLAQGFLKGIVREITKEYTQGNYSQGEINLEEELRKFTSIHSASAFLKECADDATKKWKNNGGHAVIRKVKDYIESHYAEQITLKDIEEKYYINGSYFSWLFSNLEGETFTEYLTKVRINEAKKLLKGERTIRVYEIAEMVGYRDYRNFSKAFKRHVGLTPLRYRESGT